ncbi:hypothetical protein PS2_044417 [Malus domestica]
MGRGICRDEAELRVENHAAGADVADAIETESNVAEQEKHTNLRTQDPPPERSMEASCGVATVAFADRGSGLSWRSTYFGCAHHVQQAGFGGVRQQRTAQRPADLEMFWRAWAVGQLRSARWE